MNAEVDAATDKLLKRKKVKGVEQAAQADCRGDQVYARGHRGRSTGGLRQERDADEPVPEVAVDEDASFDSDDAAELDDDEDDEDDDGDALEDLNWDDTISRRVGRRSCRRRRRGRGHHSQVIARQARCVEDDDEEEDARRRARRPRMTTSKRKPRTTTRTPTARTRAARASPRPSPRPRSADPRSAPTQRRCSGSSSQVSWGLIVIAYHCTCSHLWEVFQHHRTVHWYARQVRTSKVAPTIRWRNESKHRRSEKSLE